MLRRIFTRCWKLFVIARAFLFGSHARGEHGTTAWLELVRERQNITFAGIEWNDESELRTDESDFPTNSQSMT